ncbi:Sterol regulatory element-binding protein cleavage-activating protein [Neofusicoccum parvum]|uniref:Sterol regulatory element-binding protein cleavage-activating protein n=1 Tax=Neofusicoccum parvum TaxID=310453 RepID=A0ACB5S9I8_9PEZI|nr:Sterol regulatory element-binding protein cleavage-activating protein [Neofusicoccum parvum]GME65779.1 Sterol regulatory element-binding protein cleavage-activating protein [Neofusicoccum parvum]
MGRKPNQLILEFFERGPKLEDASNRYQHTCRSCGEKFPKGRIDTLTAHLVKKCPALTAQDRQRAILQFHDLPVPDLPPTPSSSSTQGPAQQVTPQKNGAQNPSQPMTLPYAAPKAGMSRLEALAEVSRQRLDLSGQRIPTPDPEQLPERRGSMRDDSMQNPGPVYEDFLVQDHDPKPAADANGSAVDAATHTPEASSGQPPQSIYQYEHLPTGTAQVGLPIPPVPASTPPNSSLPPASSAAPATAPPHPSPLVMAASAAEELRANMPNANHSMEQPTGANDPSHHQQGRLTGIWASIDPVLQLQDATRDHSEPHSPSPTAGGSATYHRPIAINPNGQQAHFTTDFSMNPKPAKPKVRGRFSDSRRKEVQEVRKRGACIRCRMLKKPNVESARLWKHPCIRTRIAEEFNLYSAGLHSVLAFHSISSAKANMHFEHIPGRIEARLVDIEPTMYTTFTTLKALRGVNAPIDPQLVASGLSMESMQDVEIIDPDVEDIGGKLESYMKRIGPTIYEAETSPFMKPTLVMAHRLSVENKEGIESKESLLSKVLELWVATRILAEPTLKFQLFFNHTQPPYKDPVILTQQDLESVSHASRFPIEPGARSESYKLIDAQILGAMEKRAANLSKFVMNDLERRLLQRQQANPFETFLVSMILLACVERMCWLFKRWENPAQVPARMYSVPPPDLRTQLENSINAANAADAAASAAENATNNVDHNVTMTDVPPQQDAGPLVQAASDAVNALFSQPHPNRWPLDKPPASYSQQGERFSDILHMLLKMRGVPPKTTTEPITNIVVPIDNMTNNQTTNATINPKSDALAKEWFSEVKITPQYLAERRNAPFHGIEPREWECFYVSKILVHNGIVEGTGRLVP